MFEDVIEEAVEVVEPEIEGINNFYKSKFHNI